MKAVPMNRHGFFGKKREENTIITSAFQIFICKVYRDLRGTNLWPKMGFVFCSKWGLNYGRKW